MPSTRLCAFGCNTIGVTIHNFPNPAMFPERFKVWVNLVGQALHGLSDDDIYKRKKVCDIHFTEQDRNRNSRLNALAVTTLHLPSAPISNPTVENIPAVQPQMASTSETAVLSEESQTLSNSYNILGDPLPSTSKTDLTFDSRQTLKSTSIHYYQQTCREIRTLKREVCRLRKRSQTFKERLFQPGI